MGVVISPGGEGCRHVHVTDDEGRVLEVLTLDEVDARTEEARKSADTYEEVKRQKDELPTRDEQVRN